MPRNRPPASRPSSRISAVVLGALAALALAVGPSAAQEPPSTLVRSSDARLQAMAAELLPELARRSGLELTEPVRLEKRSRAQLVRYLEHKLDEELSAEEARETVEAYHLLGLVPEDLDLRSLLLSLYTEQVAGFYEPDSTALFILDDQPPQALQGLLVHELVHAVQDQSADLQAITDPELGNDRTTAAQAAIEGHATLVMLEYLQEAAGASIDLSEMPDFGRTLRSALEGMRSQFPALAGAPPVIQEALLFPYLEGAGFVHRLWVEEDRVAPFGEWLPSSTEQILTGNLADEPVALEVVPEGPRIVHDDVLGRLELGIFLDTRAGEGSAAAARGWGGDRWVLVEGPDGGRGLVLAVAWDTEGHRTEFVRTLRNRLGGLPSPADLTTMDSPVGPVALLRIGEAAQVPVTIRPAEGA